MKSTHSKIVAIGVRLLIVVACVALILNLTDAAEVGRAIMTLPLRTVFVVVVLHAVIIIALAWRWAVLVQGTGSKVAYLNAIKVTFMSTLLNLSLPTSVGGDIGRVWFGKRLGVEYVSGSAAAVLDRGIGLVTLVAMVCVSAFWIGGAVTTVVLPAALILGVMTLALLLRWAGRLPKQSAGYRIAAAVRTIVRDKRLLSLTMGISLLSHVAAAMIAAVIANAMQLPLTALNATMLFPIVLLATAIPVSIGGWGLRELAAIPVLALAGIGPDGATAIAFVFGLTHIATAFVGSVVSGLIIRPTAS